MGVPVKKTAADVSARRDIPEPTSSSCASPKGKAQLPAPPVLTGRGRGAGRAALALPAKKPVFLKKGEGSGEGKNFF